MTGEPVRGRAPNSMVLPIHIYGDPVLREEAVPVSGDSVELQAFLDDMIETMRHAEGIGLAAPQVGKSIRVFVVDLMPLADREDEDPDTWPEQPMVFINPEIVGESEQDCEYEEGCLSIPDVREAVIRPERVRMRYLDREFREREIEAGGMLARVTQHEYDHLDGVLFVDLISPFRRKILQRRLKDMSRGLVEADYPLAIADRG